MKLIATFPLIRTVIEDDQNILVEGHSGVFDASDESFSKPKHVLIKTEHQYEIYEAS